MTTKQARSDMMKFLANPANQVEYPVLYMNAMQELFNSYLSMEAEIEQYLLGKVPGKKLYWVKLYKNVTGKSLRETVDEWNRITPFDPA